MSENKSAEVFYLHNTSRSPHTRDVRRTLPSPESSTKNLYIGGTLRVVRGRPFPLRFALVMRHLKELIEKEKNGLVALFDGRSRRVPLASLSPTRTAEVVDTPPVETAVPVPDTDVVIDAPPVAIENSPLASEAPESQTTADRDEITRDEHSPLFSGRRKRR